MKTHKDRCISDDEFATAIATLLMKQQPITPTTLQKNFFPHIKNRSTLAYYLDDFKSRHQMSFNTPSRREIVFGIATERQGKVTIDEMQLLTGFSWRTCANYISEWRKKYRNEYFL